jgi:hypothetical protein
LCEFLRIGEVAGVVDEGQNRAQDNDGQADGDAAAEKSGDDAIDFFDGHE